MKLTADIRIADIEEVVQALGGKISWPEGGLRQSYIDISVDVDPTDAHTKLAEYGWLYDFGDVDRADPLDVRDFVAAIGRGDRLIASALAPRLFATDSNLAACDRGLFEARAA